MNTLNKLTKEQLLQYTVDCHGLNAYDLGEHDICSKAEIIEAIQSYGWEVECLAWYN